MPTIRRRGVPWLLRTLSICAIAALASCGGDGFLSAQPVTSDTPVAGPTPFIAYVTIHGVNLDRAIEVRFRVHPRAGSTTRPIQATYTRRYLSAHADATATSDDIRIPVFGLYAGAQNDVDVGVLFDDGSVANSPCR